MSAEDVTLWASGQGRAIDTTLETLADRRLALRELERIALRISAEQQTLGVTLDALIAAHRDDPIQAANLRAIFARALEPETDERPHAPTQEDKDDRYGHNTI